MTLREELDRDILQFWDKLSQRPEKEVEPKAAPKIESETFELKGREVERFLTDPGYREIRLRSPNSNGLGN